MQRIKQVLSGAVGLLMSGATLMTPALADFTLDNFNTMTADNTVVVVGTDAKAMDIVGAINVGAAIAQNGATATGVTTTAASSVTGGVSLDNANTKLNMGDKINAVRNTLTSDDMPVVLASRTFTNDAGKNYKYDQYVVLDDQTIAYEKNVGSLKDPVLHITNPSTVTSTAYLMALKVVFNNNLDVTDTDVNGNSINLFGKSYTIDPTSTNAKLILRGSSQSEVISEGSELDLAVAGTAYTVKVLGVSGANNVVVQVGSASKTLTKGNSYTVNGLDIYVDDIYYYTKETQVSQAKLSFGSDKLTLENNKKVTTGSSDTNIDGSLVDLTYDTTDGISQIVVYVGADKTKTNYVGAGDTYTDPVFKSVKLSLKDIDFTSADRSKILIGTSGDKDATLTFTDAKGNEKTIEFAQDNSGTLKLKDSDGNAIKVVEGVEVGLDEYTIINQDDFSHLMKVTDIDVSDNDDAVKDKGTVTYEDVMSGTSYEVTLVETEIDSRIFQGTKIIDGKTYYVEVDENVNTKPVITWGADATYNDAGAKITVYPVLVGQKGEKIALTESVDPSAATNDLSGYTSSNVASTAIIELPTGTAQYEVTDTGATTTIKLLIDGVDSSASVGPATTTTTPVTVGGVSYDITVTTTDNTGADNATLTIDTVVLSGKTTPAVLVVEEEDESNVKKTIIVTTSDNANKIEIDTSVITTDSTSLVSTSDSDIQQGVDAYGTFIETDSSDQNTVTLYYPDDQMNVVVGVGADPKFDGTGVSSTGTVTSVALGNGIAKLASEAEADKSVKNLVLMGGPYANSLVEELAVAGKTPTKAQWNSMTGKAIIQAIDGAFVNGKAAIVVAGYDKEQTRSAALKLMKGGLTGAMVEVVDGTTTPTTYVPEAEEVTPVVPINEAA